jgi:hypothetical protein
MISVSVYYGNMQIQNNLIDTALQLVWRSLYFWFHPKLAPQPLKRRVFIDGYFGTN